MTFELWEGEPEQVALRQGNAAWTRGQLAEAAATHARQLHDEFGVEPGVICATLVTGSAAGIAALGAGFTSRGVVAPLSPSATPHELADALAQLRPQVLLAEPSTEALARAAISAGAAPASSPKSARRIQLVTCGGPDRELEAVRSELAAPVESAGSRAASPTAAVLRLPADRAFVIWTSGTTGRPRAIALRGDGVRQAALAQIAHLGIAPGDALPLVLPLNAVGGLMVIVRAALAHAVIEALPRFDATHLIELANAGRADHVSLVPVMLQRLVDQMVDPLRQAEPGSAARGPSPTHGFGTLLIGGAACPVGLVRDAVSSGLRVALTWGMTESCAQAATALPDEVAADPASVGHALPHVQVRVEPDGRLALRLAALDPAEVRLREPDRDDSPILTSLCDEDGWFVTGDLGSVAADGRISVTGRASDRIISGGVNVDPGEVEQILARHPAVAEAAVVGVPDDEWGERVCALVVAAVRRVPDGAPKADSEPAREPLIAELESHAREQLTAAKRPRQWRVVDALPRTAAGKIDRAACASHFAIQSPHASD